MKNSIIYKHQQVRILKRIFLIQENWRQDLVKISNSRDLLVEYSSLKNTIILKIRILVKAGKIALIQQIGKFRAVQRSIHSRDHHRNLMIALYMLVHLFFKIKI